LSKEVQRIYGTPAPYMGINKVVSSEIGGMNEINTALKINALINMDENVYVFHSVSIYNADGETDHVIVYHNKIILLETKTHSGHHGFRISNNGRLYGRKGSKEFLVDDNHLFYKAENLQKRFPKHKVEAVIVISQRNIQTRSVNPTYHVASLDTFDTVINARLIPDKKMRNRKVIKYFTALVQ
jgi:hypothetical protein